MDHLWNVAVVDQTNYPRTLRQLKKLPVSMDVIGTLPGDGYSYLCVVGSREYSDYGKDACQKLIAGLAGYPIVIVSGLALGIDSIAHEAALAAGLKTIAFPGSGLNIDILYPARHLGLARRIVESGGALISPFKRDQPAAQWTFPSRNKLMAGISHATLVIEADQDSGTLITADDALEFSRDLLVVPGSIWSPNSKGSNSLFARGALPISSSTDILKALGFEIDEMSPSPENETAPLTLFDSRSQIAFSDDEQRVFDAIGDSIQKDELIYKLELPVGYLNSLLIEMEVKGMIKEEGGVIARRMI